MDCSVEDPKNNNNNHLKIELPFDPVILLLDIYSEKNEHSNSKRYMHPMFATLFMMNKIWKQHMSMNWWIDKEDVVYIYKFRLMVIKIFGLLWVPWFSERFHDVLKHIFGNLFII